MSDIFEGILFEKSTSTYQTVTVILYSDKLVLHNPLVKGPLQNQTWNFIEITDYQQISGNKVRIEHHSRNGQVLEIVSEDFAKKFKLPKTSIEKLKYKVSQSFAGVVLIIGAIIIALLAGIYFFALPWTAEKLVMLIPVKYEVEIGETLYKNSIKNENVDSTKTRLANQFMKKIDFQTDYPLHVTIVKSSVKNAFALPGGHVVIFSKLLDDMKSYEELVALLGHEVGHVKHRHTTKHMMRTLSSYAILSLFFGDLSGVIAVVAENGNQLHQLSYSRSLETEADEAGFQTLLDNKVNPQGLISLFENLQKGNEAGAMIPEFLSTHPVTENRMSLIREKIKENKSVFVDNSELKEDFISLKN